MDRDFDRSFLVTPPSGEPATELLSDTGVRAALPQALRSGRDALHVRRLDETQIEVQIDLEGGSRTPEVSTLLGMHALTAAVLRRLAALGCIERW